MRSMLNTEKGLPPMAENRPYRILLVDDEPGIRKILRLFLEREGYTVFEAITASQAMDVIVREKPHLVILDVILCGQTGFDVCVAAMP